MQQSIHRFHLALICVGLTLLMPLILPLFYVLYDLLMSRMVSVVWADLHFTAYALLQLLFVYGISAALVIWFLVSLQIDKRLQPQYASTNLWLVGGILGLIVLGLNILIATQSVSLVASESQWLARVLLAAKIILLIATVRTLIGVLPRAK
jgi:hypothetical protein